MEQCDTEGANRDAGHDEHEASDSEQATLRDALAAMLRDAEAMAKLCRSAERYARVPRDSAVARDLVWDVVGDVLLGAVTCASERPLAVQLGKEVKRRAKDLRRKASRTTTIPLEDASPTAFAVDAEPSSLGDDEHGPLDAADLLSQIRAYARDDRPARQLLALYERGVVLRRDVLCAGMSEWAYRSARERLVGYAVRAKSAIRSHEQAEPEDSAEGT